MLLKSELDHKNLIITALPDVIELQLAAASSWPEIIRNAYTPRPYRHGNLNERLEDGAFKPQVRMSSKIHWIWRLHDGIYFHHLLHRSCSFIPAMSSGRITVSKKCWWLSTGRKHMGNGLKPALGFYNWILINHSAINYMFSWEEIRKKNRYNKTGWFIFVTLPFHSQVDA